MTAWLRRLRARIKYRGYARELEQELAVHREMAARDQAGAGTPDQIRRAVALQLGNTTLVREDVRAMWLPKLFQELMQDVRYASRSFRREWRFTVAAVALLSMGLSVTVGGFVLLNGLLLRGWPVPDSAAVFRVKPMLPPSAGRVDDGLSFGAYRHIAANATRAEYVAYGGAYVRIGTTRDQRFPGSVPVGIYVSDNFFTALQIPLQLGTPPRAGSEGLEPTVVIADHVWRSIFSGDPDVIGRQAWLDGKPVTIAGVTAPEFTGLDQAAGVYVPLWAAPQMSARGSIQDAVKNDQACCVSVAGRRKPGHQDDAIAAELMTLTSQYRTSVSRPSITIALGNTSNGDAILARGLAPMLALVGAGAIALFLLTCANVGNLYLARSLRRQHEVTTRLAIGAGRGRLIRQLLTEGFVLAAIAGLAVLAAASAVPSVVVASGGDVSAARFSTDLSVVLATMGAVLFVCLIVSLAPALRTTRVVWRGGAAMATARSGGLRGLLLGVQVALATVLVLSATLITRGIQHGLDSPMGFAVETTTAGQIVWPPDITPGTAKRAALRASLLAASSQTAPIGLVSSVPVSGKSGLVTSVRPPQVEVDYSISLFPMSVSATEVLDLKLASGRWMTDDARDREAVINETLARLIWGNESAIGRTLALDFNDTDFTIVGVTKDAHLRGPRQIEPIMHIAHDDGALFIVTSQTTEAQSAIRALLKTLDPAASIRFTPLSESIQATMRTATGGAIIAGSLGAAALLLAMLGVYGVFSYLVEERRREIGIRLALGASPGEIRRAVFHATRWALAGGLGIGLVLSAIAGFALQGFLFGLSPADPLSYIALAAILTTTAMVATLAPIRRAARVDPATTLRAT